MNRKITFIVVVVIFVLALLIPSTAAALDDKEKVDVSELESIIRAKTRIIEELKQELAEKEQRIKELEETIEIEQEPKTEYYSDTIQILVTEEQKNKVKNLVENYDNEISMLAKLIYREARGIKSTDQKAGVVWCVLNRVDNGEYGNSISAVISAKHQFAWVPNTPVEDEFYELAKDVVTRWLLEKEGIEDVGRVLPNDYLFFAGREGKNWFRKNYDSRSYWDWSANSPY